MYRITEFGSTSLPQAQSSYTAGTAPTVSSIVSTVDGVFDLVGTDLALPKLPYTLQYSCLAYASSQSTLRSTLDALRALRGKKQKLYRQTLGTSPADQWAWARLKQVAFDHTYKHGLTIAQPIVMEFEVLSYWHGEPSSAWLLDDGYYMDDGLYLDEGTTTAFTLDSSPKDCVVANSGNILATEVQLSVLAGSADITALTISMGGIYNWTYSGTISAGEELLIDCRAFTVLNNGDDDYANFSLNSGHLSYFWLALEPGNNTVTVTKTGGSTDSVLTFVFYDAWA